MEGILGRRGDWLLELIDSGDVWAIPQWNSINVTMALGRPSTLTVRMIGGTGVDAVLKERRSDIMLRLDGNSFLRTRLLTIKDTLDERGVPVYLAGVKEGVHEVLVRSGLRDRIGADRFFLSAHRAVRHILRGWGRSEEYLSRLPGAEATERR